MKLETLLQVGIVTEDLEGSIAALRQFGFEEWEPMPFRPDFIPNMIQDGKPGDLAFDGATCQKDGVEFELIHPISESVFMDFMRKYGTAVHHLAFRPVGGYDSFMEEYRATWGKPLLEVSDDQRRGGFGYLNTMDKIGFNVEIHIAKPGAPADEED